MDKGDKCTQYTSVRDEVVMRSKFTVTGASFFPSLASRCACCSYSATVLVHFLYYMYFLPWSAEEGGVETDAALCNQSIEAENLASGFFDAFQKIRSTKPECCKTQWYWSLVLVSSRPRVFAPAIVVCATPKQARFPGLARLTGLQ